MKTAFLIFFSLVLLGLHANAGLPPTATRGNGESSYATTFKFDFPNISVSRSGSTTTFNTVNVAGGGTGATSLTANNVILGNGTSAVQFVAPGTLGNVLKSDGSTWVSDTVTFGTDVMTVPGVNNPDTCYFAYGGGGSTLSSPVTCTTASCTEIYDSCSIVSGCTRSSTGVYSCTLSNGAWVANSFVWCQEVSLNSLAGLQMTSFGSDANGALVVGPRGWSSSATPADTAFSVKCEGARP